MPLYPVKRRLKRNGKRYVPGSLVEFTQDDVAEIGRLVKTGVIGEAYASSAEEAEAQLRKTFFESIPNMTDAELARALQVTANDALDAVKAEIACRAEGRAAVLASLKDASMPMLIALLDTHAHDVELTNAINVEIERRQQPSVGSQTDNGKIPNADSPLKPADVVKELDEVMAIKAKVELLAVLDQSAAHVIEAIAAKHESGAYKINSAQLMVLGQAEQDGKTRKTVLQAIDTELHRRHEAGESMPEAPALNAEPMA